MALAGIEYPSCEVFRGRQDAHPDTARQFPRIPGREHAVHPVRNMRRITRRPRQCTACAPTRSQWCKPRIGQQDNAHRRVTSDNCHQFIRHLGRIDQDPSVGRSNRRANPVDQNPVIPTPYAGKDLCHPFSLGVGRLRACHAVILQCVLPNRSYIWCGGMGNCRRFVGNRSQV